MKKSFCLVAVLCLLGNVTYAFDPTKIADFLNQSSISSTKQKEWQTILNEKIIISGTTNKKSIIKIRTFDEIKNDQIDLQTENDPDTSTKLKALEDEENDYNKKAKSFASFQRALANAYRYKISPDKIISAFIAVFYED